MPQPEIAQGRAARYRRKITSRCLFCFLATCCNTRTPKRLEITPLTVHAVTHSCTDALLFIIFFILVLFSKKAGPLLRLTEKEQREGPDRLIEKDRLINRPVKRN